MDIQKIFDKVEPIFTKHRDGEHIEMEFRFGKFNGKMFDTNVGKQTFDMIYEGLSNYNQWENIVTTETEVFYRTKDKVRLVVNEDTGDESLINKTLVKNEDFKKMKNTPLDVRFSVSKEIPLTNNDKEMEKKKTKNRTSFIRKNLSIDMTIVKGDAVDDPDSEDPCVYQVEMEIIDPKNITNKNELFNLVYKVKDLFIMLDNTK